jgi:hypothetical protein
MLVFYCMKCNPKKKKWVYIRRLRDFDGPSEALKRAIIDTGQIEIVLSNLD